MSIYAHKCVDTSLVGRHYERNIVEKLETAVFSSCSEDEESISSDSSYSSE